MKRAARAIPLWLCAAAFMLFAMSLKATVGGHVIYDILAPQWIIDALAALHGSACFLRPHYLAITAAIAGAAITVTQRWPF